MQAEITCPHRDTQLILLSSGTGSRCVLVIRVWNGPVTALSHGAVTVSCDLSDSTEAGRHGRATGSLAAEEEEGNGAGGV